VTMPEILKGVMMTATESECLGLSLPVVRDQRERD
jgi:hypothetical protein